MEGRVAKLKKCLQALAADADGQLNCLRAEGFSPPAQYVDELALDYDAIAAAAGDMLLRNEIDSKVFEAVQGLNEFLSQISGRENSQLWTEEALRFADEWQEVRTMAKDCLGRLQ